MIGKYVVMAVTILLMVILFCGQATGFLFPDLKALRIGSRGQSRYKIAVLQEEPFLYANGTGYVPELLRLIGDWYAATKDGEDNFPYDVIGVDTWSALMTKASTPHWQISYGLISPSLLRNELPWKSMQSSLATIQTALKMVTLKKTTTVTNVQAPITSTTTSTVTTTATTSTDTTTSTTATSSGEGKSGPTPPTTLLLENNYHSGNRIDLKGATVVTLEGSPEEHLLKKTHKYRHRQLHLKAVQTNNEALSYIRQHPNVFLVKDSAAVHVHEQQHESELVTVCPKKSMTAGIALYYGFFGRDHSIIQFLNGALRKLRTAAGDHDTIRDLNAKYFGHIRTCP